MIGGVFSEFGELLMSSGLFGRLPRPEFSLNSCRSFVERSMAPLSDTAKTALVARLRMARSGKRLDEEKLVQPLANHLARRGESVADLPWDVECRPPEEPYAKKRAAVEGAWHSRKKHPAGSPVAEKNTAPSFTRHPG